MNINTNYNNDRDRTYGGMARPDMDSFSKGIQNQIANAQKQLQDLASREDLSPEEKMKKRQEIQKQVNDLNNQLRQHQIEQRNEKQRIKESSAGKSTDMTKSKAQNRNRGRKNGLSTAGMEALISADHAMSQAEVQKGVETDLKGEARILKSEIKQDAGRGSDTSKKEETLAKLEGAAENAAASRIQTLGEAGQKMRDAAEDDASKELLTPEEEQKEQEADHAGEKSVNVLV